MTIIDHDRFLALAAKAQAILDKEVAELAAAAEARGLKVTLIHGDVLVEGASKKDIEELLDHHRSTILSTIDNTVEPTIPKKETNHGQP